MGSSTWPSLDSVRNIVDGWRNSKLGLTAESSSDTFGEDDIRPPGSVGVSGGVSGISSISKQFSLHSSAVDEDEDDLDVEDEEDESGDHDRTPWKAP